MTAFLLYFVGSKIWSPEVQAILAILLTKELVEELLRTELQSYVYLWIDWIRLNASKIITFLIQLVALCTVTLVCCVF